MSMFSESARISWRMKISRVSASAWLLASVIQPLWAARKLLTAVTIPT